jgi:TatA/E family protein of Tat protein translocase
MMFSSPFFGFLEGLGGSEMFLVFMIILFLFGGKKLPEFARGMGKSIRQFKKAASGVEDEFKRALEEDERQTFAEEARARAAAAEAEAKTRAAALPPAAATPALLPPTEPAVEIGNEIYPLPDPEPEQPTPANQPSATTVPKPNPIPPAPPA